MDQREIIKSEAREFYTKQIYRRARYTPIVVIREMKTRVADFYSPEDKVLFLEHIEILITRELKEHRDKSHGGKAVLSCPKEEPSEKLLFYIRQEIGVLPTIAHRKYDVSGDVVRDKVFVSYSHKDEEYLVDIRRHFKPFLKNIKFWDDSKILPGQKWKEEIRKAISETKVAILLVSTDFLGSEFISTNELPPLLEAAEKEGAVILIVILKPCLFEEIDNLNIYQTMNPPSFPISKMNDNEREELFVNLVRQTKRILQENS